MKSQVISTGAAPQVIISAIMGDLRIKGWEEDQIQIDADPDEINLEETAGAFHLECQGDCTLRLPQDASLSVDSVHGDAVVKSVLGSIVIGEAHGSLTLKNVGPTRLTTVHGELLAKDVAGDLSAEVVQGNASLRDIRGACRTPEVHGNLDLRDAGGNLQANAHGNARVRLSSLGGDQYEIEASGNAHCNIPEDADLQLSLSSGAQVIRVKLPGHTQTLRQAQCEFTTGAGAGAMRISAGGSLYLFGQSSDWAERDAEFGVGYSGLPEDFSEQIAQQVHAQITSQMEMMTEQINHQMERLSDQIGKSGMSAEEIERIMGKARQTSEREAERAQEKMRRAQEKLERNLEAARRRQELKAQASVRREGRRRSWSFEFPTPPAPPAPAAEPVSEEERLMILRMLEQKKISLDEANQLLSALEGKEN
ncbi:MAG: hypothetical protein AB1894_14765 [Chloroflexota bacterium]